jgi:hypothetical protein
MTLAELRITDVWAALGGPELRRNGHASVRAPAFWRNGKDRNVSISVQKNCWHDFVTDDKGGILALVMIVEDCGAHAALGWLEHNAGLTPRPLEKETEEERERRRKEAAGRAQEQESARHWSYAVRVMLEARLAELPPDSRDRRGPTWLLQELRKAGEGVQLVPLYLSWRANARKLTAALTFAGRRSERRLLRRIEYTFERLLEKSSEAA